MVDVVDAKSTVASLSAAGGGYSEGAASAAVEISRANSEQEISLTANEGDIQPPKAATIFIASGALVVEKGITHLPV